MRREAAARSSTGTGTDPNLGAINTLSEDRTTVSETKITKKTVPDTGSPSERITPGMTAEDRARAAATTAHTAGNDNRSMTEKAGSAWEETKRDVKETIGMNQPEEDRTRIGQKDERMAAGTTMTQPGAKGATRDVDWESIQHPGMEPCDDNPYATRPVSELTPPTEVRDKADLAATRMLGRDQESMDRERIMTEATPEAAAARAAMASKETTMTPSEAERERMKTGAAATGAALGAGAAATRTETEAERERRMKTGAAMTGAVVAAGAAALRTSPEADERTTRTGAALGTKPVTPVVTERPVTGTVISPGTERATPMKPYGTVDERSRIHAEDPSVHPDWETQPQINAPRDVGIPTAEGQADATRIRAGQRRSDVAEEPRVDRRGGEYEVPAASAARGATVSGAMKETARDIKETGHEVKESAKETGRDIKESAKETTKDVKRDVDRKI